MTSSAPSDDRGQPVNATDDTATPHNNTVNKQLTSEQLHAQRKQQRIKQKQFARLEHESAVYNRRGVAYLSNIPPHMQPATIKQLLSQYNNAVIHRIYCQPVDNKSKHGRHSNSKHLQYLDGWVEFDDKRVAKHVCGMINGQQIGGKKQSQWYYDIWNIKYLTGFKWHHLTDKIHSDRARQSSAMRDELVLAQAESEQYSKQVQLAKYQARKRKSGDGEVADSTADEPVRQFKQRRMIDTGGND